MPLLLRIENIDTLPDGGPVKFEVNRRGLDIGRDPYLDWTLPDSERFISGKHCEIRYRDGGYWLHDVSTNGTTVNGRGGRLTEPHRLQHGDRVHIGHYIVAVELSGEETRPAGTEASSSKSGGASDPWGGIDDAAASVDRRDFAAHSHSRSSKPTAHGPTDLSEEDISWSIGRVTQAEPSADGDIWDAPVGGAGAAADSWGWSQPAPGAEPGHASGRSAGAGAPRSSAAGTDGSPPDDPFASGAVGAGPGTVADAASRGEAAVPEAFPHSGPPSHNDPFSSSPDAAERDEARASVAATEAPDPARSAAQPGLASRWADGAETPRDRPAAAGLEQAGQAGDFVAAFERGAGMPAGSVADRGDDAFAEELGRLFRLVTQNLQAMLAARAETKSAMRSSERTMIGALENNPLKFSPTPEDALRIMFGAKTRSYLDAGKTIESSFRDLQQHQVQTFAAMQQALQALIEDLDPSSIEEATARDGGLSGIVGSRRARFWDTYVERFRAKSGRHERGMIDAFMILFAEMYDRQR